MEFAKFLSDNGKDIWIRHVLADGITDDDGYLQELGKFIGKLETVKKIEVLPYHNMGEAKYVKLGLPYPLKGNKPPERERIEYLTYIEDIILKKEVLNMQIKAWEGFKLAKWSEHGEVNVRDFIQNNYTPYDGGDEFLAPPTKATLELWQEILKLTDAERKAGGVLDADTKTVSTLTSHPAGYIDKKLEKIVGLQTDKPFKRALQPFGGIKMAEQALSMYGYEIDPEVKNIFTNYRKSHNDGVYDAYTLEMRRARRAHILTGLPDTYGRGRIVGDYRRVALYGVDYLIECKENDKTLKDGDMTPEKIRDREELSEQIKALKALKKLAEIYGCDISKPAENAKDAIQALYFGYLAAVKDQNGAARQKLDVPRYLYPARFRARNSHRRRCAGAYRPVRNETENY